MHRFLSIVVAGSFVAGGARAETPSAPIETRAVANAVEVLAAESRAAEALVAALATWQDDVDTQDSDDALGVGETFTSEATHLTRYGEEGTWQFNIFASGAWGDVNADKDGPEANIEYFGGGFGVDYFIWDDFSIGGQLVGLSFTQDGPETAGGAFEALLRWHFVSESTWSIYVDGGAGFLKTSDDVPPHGTNFNFTPQAGVGFTIEIGGQVRAMSGIRWHHISNADSADSNPGIDSIMVYAGITAPF